MAPEIQKKQPLEPLLLRRSPMEGVVRFLRRLYPRELLSKGSFSRNSTIIPNIKKRSLQALQVLRPLLNRLKNITPQKILSALDHMTLKKKIRAALVVLFTSITFMGILGGYYVHRTSNSMILMLRENYTTLKYTTIMSQAINDMIRIVPMKGATASYKRVELQKAFSRFEQYLNLQMSKATLKEEQDFNDKLKVDYEIFKNSLRRLLVTGEFPIDMQFKRDYILSLINSVNDMNGSIIEQRTEEASNTANRVTMLLIIMGFFFTIFVLFALFYFPHYFASPIQSMTESIQQIAQKNYNQRLPVHHKDELGKMAESFNAMAKKLAEYDNVNVAQILTEKQRTETIIQRMNEAIIGLDDEKTILFANPPALELTELPQEELVGQSARHIAMKTDFLSNLFEEVLFQELPDSATFPTIRMDKNGKRQYFNKDVLKVPGQAKNKEQPTNVGYVIILKNITDLKEADLAKTNFMATLSHELKTPISAIDMSLNLLADNRIGPLNEEQQDLSATIRQNTSRLLRMINEILEISRIETGKLQLKLEDTAPDALIVRALDNVKTFIVEKEIAINQYIEPNLPTLRLDVHKTTAVLVNFLTNAVRYSAEKQAIEIIVVRQDSLVEFAVKDHGPGISKEEQRKLFQPYRRAEGDKTKGTGLGLAISKEFVEAQGGKIWVESKLGSGSTFGFVLPVG
ncbi:MAG: HAMP domain-containing protein [Saprospiraceae bacterium]|nr:MAG: HAMP domain-containing protein [Saprospiraceae bacterium]